MMNKQKNIKKFALVIFVLMSFLVSNFHVNTAHAIAPVILYGAATVAAGALATNKVQNIVVDGFKWFLYGVFSVCAFLAMLAAEIFSYVLDVSHLQAIMANPVVWEMWKIVRDFMNLFFIFVLLLSAFYTIFQVDKYSYKNVLSKVIFGALFVNFSFPIARAIIDVGNVMMYSFIVDIFGMSKDGLTSGVLSTSGLKGLFLLSENNLDFTVKYFLIAIICMFMFGVSFLTLALMMFYRLFMLPILVMFSPIGFVAGAIPGMEGYSKQWWDKLIKNVFYGPIAVFMVMLAVQFMKSLSSAQNNTITKGMVEANGVSGDFLASIVYMTIPIIFFWIAITSAEKMSSEAGGLANSFGSKFLKWSGGSALKFGGRKIERGLASNKYTKYLSPSVAIKAWTDRAKEHEEKDKEHLDLAAASMQDELNAGISRGTDSWFGMKPWKLKQAMLHPSDRTNHAYAARAHAIAKAKKEVSEVSTNSDYLIEEFDAAMAMKDETKVKAILEALAKDNNLNDFMAARGGRYGAMMQTIKDKNGNDKLVPIISPENYSTVIQDVLKKAGMKPGSEEMALDMLSLSEVATASGNYGAGGMVAYSNADKKWKIQSPADQAKWAAGKVKNLESQKRQATLHPDSAFKYYYDDDGNRHIIDLSEAGVALMSTFTNADAGQANRAREDFKVGVHELEVARAAGSGSPAYSQLLEDHPVVVDYAKAIEVFYTVKDTTAKAETQKKVDADKAMREKIKETGRAHNRR